MSRFLSQALNGLNAYVAGEQPQDKKYIKLNTNESPFPPSEKAIKAVTKNTLESLSLYCDPTAKALCEAIAKVYNVREQNVITSNGSDEILSFAFLAFKGDKPTAFPDISYGFYSVFAQLYSLKTRVVPLTQALDINPDDYLISGENVVLANPNAPTGKALSLDNIEKILKAHENDIVLIDEAYVDFGAQSAVSLIDKYDNLLVVQTFSKSRSLAGARVGFAIAREAIINDLQTIRNSFNPYNVNAISQIMAANSMLDTEYFKRCTKEIIETREEFAQGLQSLGFSCLESCTNFVFAKADGKSGEEIYKGLKENGILVRWFDKERIRDYVRISIGTRAQMQAVLTVLKQK